MRGTEPTVDSNVNSQRIDVEILEKFFTLYDKYGKGEVNAAEVLTALAILVRGEVEDKMKRT